MSLTLGIKRLCTTADKLRAQRHTSRIAQLLKAVFEKARVVAVFLYLTPLTPSKRLLSDSPQSLCSSSSPVGRRDDELHALLEHDLTLFSLGRERELPWTA